jgi:hypothetical protein|eukprot:scaffold4595_cov191-Alexandrium_tamarense.AAC.4
MGDVTINDDDVYLQSNKMDGILLNASSGSSVLVICHRDGIERQWKWRSDACHFLCHRSKR